MADFNVSQEDYEKLIEDAQYLQDEAEALKYIIEAVPYTEVPSGGMSIIQQLMLIDYAQTDYYRPLIEKSFSSARTVDLSKQSDFRDTFQLPDDDEEITKDVQKVLNRIVKHRAALINIFKKIPLIDWERELKSDSGAHITLYEFTNSMIREERKILKEIADLVLIYQNNRQAQREIDAKRDQRNQAGD